MKSADDFFVRESIPDIFGGGNFKHALSRFAEAINQRRTQA